MGGTAENLTAALRAREWQQGRASCHHGTITKTLLLVALCLPACWPRTHHVWLVLPTWKSSSPPLHKVILFKTEVWGRLLPSSGSFTEGKHTGGMGRQTPAQEPEGGKPSALAGRTTAHTDRRCPGTIPNHCYSPENVLVDEPFTVHASTADPFHLFRAPSIVNPCFISWVWGTDGTRNCGSVDTTSSFHSLERIPGSKQIRQTRDYAGKHDEVGGRRGDCICKGCRNDEQWGCHPYSRSTVVQHKVSGCWGGMSGKTPHAAK